MRSRPLYSDTYTVQIYLLQNEELYTGERLTLSVNEVLLPGREATFFYLVSFDLFHTSV